MPLIPYPAVPNAAGVPLIPRNSPGAQNLTISMNNVASPVSSQEPIWGLYDTNGNPIYTPSQGGTLSVVSFGFTKGTNVSDFPVEALPGSSQGAAFASYNKVFQPANPILSLALAGSESEKNEFLAAIDYADATTSLYSVQTPDTIYNSSNGGLYTVNQYSYRRSATQGATLLIVEISLVQVFQITSSLTNIGAPQSPSAASSSNGGTVSGTTTPISPHLASVIQNILHGGAQ
jgi:hypothetical protein